MKNKDLLLMSLKAHAVYMQHHVREKQRSVFMYTMNSIYNHIKDTNTHYNFRHNEPTKEQQLALDIYKEIKDNLNKRFVYGRGTEYAVEKL